MKLKRIVEPLADLAIVICAAFLIRTFGFGLYQVPTGSMETTMLVNEFFFADKLTVLWRPHKNGDIIAFNDPLYPYSHHPFKHLIEHYVWGPSNWTKRIIGIPGDHVQGVIENGTPSIYINGQKVDEPYRNHYPLLAVNKTEQTGVAGFMSALSLSDDVANRSWVFKAFDPSKAYDAQPFYAIDGNQVLGNQKKLLMRYPDVPLKVDFNQQALLGKTGHWGGTDEFDVHLGDNQYWVMGDNRQNSFDSRFFGPIDGSLIHSKIIFRLWSIDTDASSVLVHALMHPVQFFKQLRLDRFLQTI